MGPIIVVYRRKDGYWEATCQAVPGLVAGDRWCLCAARWLEAAQAGSPPPVVLEATHEKTLAIVPLDLLRKHAVPAG